MIQIIDIFNSEWKWYFLLVTDNRFYATGCKISDLNTFIFILAPVTRYYNENIGAGLKLQLYKTETLFILPDKNYFVHVKDVLLRRRIYNLSC